MVKVAAFLAAGAMVALGAGTAEAQLTAVPVFSPASVNERYDAPTGIAFDGANLLIANGAWEGDFLRFTREGEFLGSFNPPGIAPGDLTWDGSSYFYPDVFDGVIYHIDGSGNVLGTIPTADFSDSRIGLAWDGRYLWAVDENTAQITLYDVITGQRVRTFAAPEAETLALAWDGQTMWAGTLFGNLYQLSPDGSVIGGPYTVENISRIYGLAYDGQFLYSTDPVTDFVYRISLPASGDGDGDGVPDGQDQCARTPAGLPVDGRGCAVEDLCPCEGGWKNKGSYVSCVARTASAFFKAGILTGEQRRSLTQNAAQSSCGGR